ncbi:unnamed protein product [Ilex paraguariensis]|uniref:Uncharacterized protein n=1 Tax=Ilex paraguariensis TaxID=185542 RepID=A0ABC8S291_9AQUA
MEASRRKESQYGPRLNALVVKSGLVVRHRRETIIDEAVIPEDVTFDSLTAPVDLAPPSHSANTFSASIDEIFGDIGGHIGGVVTRPPGT